MNPIWNLVAGPFLGIINKLIPDKAAAAAASAQLQLLATQGALSEELAQLQAITSAQSDVNKVEAASVSLFIAGWRPYVGWICGTALGLIFIVGPLFTWVTTLCGHPTAFPKLDDPLLETILGGMLGLGHISRTVEKGMGVVENH
jgi:roadblock/LC7 domain-containing protein